MNLSSDSLAGLGICHSQVEISRSIEVNRATVNNRNYNEIGNSRGRDNRRASSMARERITNTFLSQRRNVNRNGIRSDEEMRSTQHVVTNNSLVDNTVVNEQSNTLANLEHLGQEAPKIDGSGTNVQISKCGNARCKFIR